MSISKLKIVYEDENILAVDKPAGILVYYPPHFTQTEETLLDLVAGHLQFHEIGERTGVVHRLDRDTSGIMVLAKNEKAEVELKKLFKNREIRKKYLTLVHGKLEPAEGRITIPLGRAPKDRLRVVPKASGKPSETLYRVLSYYERQNLSLLEIELKTGRMHQIRVHLSAIGHPVVGDKVYGRKSDKLGRQFLHAKSLEFTSPFSRRKIEVEADLPQDLQEFLRSL